MKENRYEFTLEVCVDSVESALAAKEGGADRLELCSNLIIGGTTPSYEMFRKVKEETGLPIHVLIRPRFGDFLYTEYERSEMEEQARTFSKMGAEGIVIGVLHEDGRLDASNMKRLIQAAREENREIKITLHRAFDLCQKPYEAALTADALGVNLILTSGQKNSCREGKDLLKLLCQNLKEKQISILAGGGIKGPKDVKDLYEIGIRDFHMSGKRTYESAMKYRNPEVSMGLDVASEYTLWRTDANLIRKITKLRESL